MLGKLLCLFEKSKRRSMDKNDINMEELNKMVSKGAILLDVRSPQEYREG